MNSAPERVILGIDPGTNVLGYGVVGVRGRGHAELVALGVVHLKGYANHYLKLGAIYTRVQGLVAEYLPDELAIEAPFHGKNVQSMLKLGRAQGVAMAAALARGIPVHEYAPRRIKQAITGQGGASKEQVAAMLQRILRVSPFDAKYLDATDAIAAALCHFYQSMGVPADSGKAKSWDEFLRSNPDRVKSPRL